MRANKITVSDSAAGKLIDKFNKQVLVMSNYRRYRLVVKLQFGASHSY